MRLKFSQIRSRFVVVLVFFVWLAMTLALLWFMGQEKRILSMNEPVSQNTLPYEINSVGIKSSKTSTQGLPVRLKIPAIQVDAKVESLGVTNDGRMDAPKEYANVGWFNQGPRPGEVGAAVVDGHFGWKNGAAVFDNLYKLKKGDRVYVEDEHGAVTSFVVRELRVYEPSADTIGVFNATDGKAHLNLITCEGTWNKKKKDYSQRLVVFTDKESLP